MCVLHRISLLYNIIAGHPMWRHVRARVYYVRIGLFFFFFLRLEKGLSRRCRLPPTVLARHEPVQRSTIFAFADINRMNKKKKNYDRSCSLARPLSTGSYVIKYIQI